MAKLNRPKNVDPATSTFVHIKALDVREVASGVFQVVLPAKPLTQSQQDVLRELYPNLSERAYDLLAQEALLGSLTDPPVVPEVDPGKPNVGVEPQSKW